MLELEVEKRIIYIPVAEATQGSTPKLSKRGLKIVPPARPTAPDIKPPKKANVTNFSRTGRLNRKSLDAIPAPSLIFRVYSCITLVEASAESIPQYKINANNRAQSS